MELRNRVIGENGVEQNLDVDRVEGDVVDSLAPPFAYSSDPMSRPGSPVDAATSRTFRNPRSVRLNRVEERVEDDPLPRYSFHQDPRVPVYERGGNPRMVTQPYPVFAPMAFDPMYMMAMQNVRSPTLKDLDLASIKKFRIDYKNYLVKLPRIPNMPIVRVPPGMFLIDEHLEIISGYSSYDVDELQQLSVNAFFEAICRLYNARSTINWFSIVEATKMKDSDWSLSTYLSYVEEFKFALLVAGSRYQPSNKEMIKSFIKGLKPSEFGQELRRRDIDTLDQVYDQGRRVVVDVQSSLDMGIGKAKPAPAKEVSDPKKTYENSKDSAKAKDKPKTSSYEKAGKKSDDSTKKNQAIQCYNCLQPGHKAPACRNARHPESTWRPRSQPSSRQVVAIEKAEQPSTRMLRCFASSIPEDSDSFVRISCALGVKNMFATTSDLMPTSIFIDTGANVNIITRSYVEELSKFLSVDIIPKKGPSTSLLLAGGKTVSISGDEIDLLLEFSTQFGPVRSVEKFLVLDASDEPLCLGVLTIKSLLGVDGMSQILFSSSIIEKEAPEELETKANDVSLFPINQSDDWNQCHFDENFEALDDLKKIVQKHSSVLFAPFDEEGLRVEPLDLDLQPNAVLKMQPARMTAGPLMDKVKSELDRLESWGVIEKIDDAEMASPLVIVPKPDGSIRLAVDYRNLNKVTKGTANQLPMQKLLFSKLSNQRYFAKIDNLWGYHQLRLTPKAQEYCSIITPWGLYKMKMLGFGISNAPGIYQQRMAGPILGDYFLISVVVYIDDTIIFAETLSEFLSRLDEVLGRMAEKNVRLKPSKCYFGFKEIQFLGHLFSYGGYTLSVDRRLSVMNIPVPTNLSELKSFLGLVNYFRDFVPNLSTIISPLTDLTRGSKKSIQWTEAADSAFSLVKEEVLKCATLSWLTEDDPIILYTDASTVGVGAVLMQLQDNMEKPILFLSKKFSDAASRWSTIEQECFALFYACIQCQSYLLGRSFFIRTDHKNLVHLSTSSVPKLVRWRLRLLEFDFIVQHLPGVENVVADCLSRSFAINAKNQDLSDSEVSAVIQSFHNDVVGHLGISKTVEVMKSAGYSFKHMREIVGNYINQCIICQKIKAQQAPTPSEVFHLHGDHPMMSLSIDTIGPLPIDSYGNAYILVILDNFSKFGALYPVKSTGSVCYIDSILNHIGVFGIPKVIRTDGGTQFTAKICEELSKILKFQHLVIVPYHPQANGLVERRNAEVMKHLRALVLSRGIQDNWSRFLPLVQRIVNFSPDSSIGTSPAKIIFGDMLPDVGFDVVTSYDGVVVSDYLKQLQTVQLELIQKSKDHLEASAIHRDASVILDPSTTFQAGDYVLLSYPSRPPSKLSALYRGPMQIVARNRSDLYEVLDLVSNKILKVHLNRLRSLSIPPDTPIDELLRIAGIDQGEFVVEKVLNHRFTGAGRTRKLDFLIRWQGYDPEYDSWEPHANVKDALALDEYSLAHPELRLG
jgi:hypothetical protein